MSIASSCDVWIIYVGQSNIPRTAEKQVAEGYEWSYVGKTAPWVCPAITVVDDPGNESHHFKLTK